MTSLEWKRHQLLKDAVNKSAVLRHTYAFLLYRQAMYERRRHRYYAALDRLCCACRRIRDLTVTRPHREAIVDVMREATCLNGRLIPFSENPIYKEFRMTRRAEIARRQFGSEPFQDRIRLRLHRDDNDEARQGNMIILKSPNSRTGEKGVLLLKYTDAFDAFAATFRLTEVLQRY